MSFKFDPALLERRAALKVEVDTRYRAPENLLAAAAKKRSHISALEDKPKVPRPRPESNGERKSRSFSSESNDSKGYKSTNNSLDKKPVTPSTPIIDKSNPIWNIPLKKKDIPIDDDDDEDDEKDKKKKFIKDFKPTTTSTTTINKSTTISNKSTTTITKPTTTTASTSSSASSNLSSNKNKTGSSSTTTKSAPKPVEKKPTPKLVEKKPALAIQSTPTKSVIPNIQPGIGIMGMGNSGNTYVRKESYLDKYNTSTSSNESGLSKNILGSTNSKLSIPEKKQGPTIVNTSLATVTGGLKYSTNHSLNNGKTATKSTSAPKRKSYSDDEDSDEDLFSDRYVKKSIKPNSTSSPHSNKNTGRSSSSNGNSSNGRSSSSSSSSSYGFSFNSGGNNKKIINNNKYSDDEESYEDDDEYENDSFIDDNSEDDEVKSFMSKIRSKRIGRYDDRDFDDRSMITRREDLEMEERKSAKLAREEDRREEERERKLKEEKERRKREYERSKRK